MHDFRKTGEKVSEQGVFATGKNSRATEQGSPISEHNSQVTEHTLRTAMPESQQAVLSASHIVKHFPAGGAPWNKKYVHAVDDVSLELKPGSVIALVGESGSGKSTVARMLAQLIQVTDGKIYLHGKPVKVKGGRAFREYSNEVQMIFQDPFASLNSIHTVRYILSRAVKVHHRQLKGKKLEQAVLALLERVRLTPAATYIDKFPHELSGGQRQRVSIARALAGDPKVLLADEPISMLDVSIRLGILNLLKELRDKDHIAILYITHDVASARYFADETIVLYAGRVAERGRSEEVTQHSAHPYTRLLVSAAPDPDNLGQTMDIPKGEVPSLIDPPSGCRFRTRCPFATDLCAKKVPPLMTAPTGQLVACWAYSSEEGRPVIPADSQAHDYQQEGEKE